jgi:hypothetical protein
MGDIHRATENGIDIVCVNKKFAKLNGYEYMRARTIFLENKKINALPIVDVNNRLIGDYSRWDDLIWTFEINNLKNGEYEKIFKEKMKRLVFIDAGELFHENNILMEKYRLCVENMGVETEVVQRKEFIEVIDRNDYVIFGSEDVKRGVVTLYRDILGRNFDFQKIRTLKQIDDYINWEINRVLNNMIGDSIAENIVSNLMDSGIFLMTLQVTGSGSIYWENLDSNIKKNVLK